MKITQPKKLNNKCTTAVRFAFTLVPTDDIIEVIQVPILKPRARKSAFPNGKTPILANTTIKLVIVEELCTNAVNKMQITIRRIGR